MRLPDIQIVKAGRWINIRHVSKESTQFILSYTLTYHRIDYGTCTINGVSAPILADTVIFKCPGDITNNSFPKCNADCEVIEFVLADPGYAPYFDTLVSRISSMNYLRQSKKCTELKEKWNRLWSVCYQREGARHREMSACVQLLDFLLALSDPNAVPKNPSPVQHTLYEAVCYMKEHLMDNLSVSEMAAHIGYSTSHFNALFRESTKKTPHAYYNELKIQEAKFQLAYTPKSISQIASDFGFQNAGKFTALFRRKTGVTPSAFRLNNDEYYFE